MAQIEGVADTPAIHLMGSPWSPDAVTICYKKAKDVWTSFNIDLITCEVCKPLVVK